VTATDRESRLLDAVASLADTLVSGNDVIDLLQLLVDTCTSLFDVEAAGLLLASPGRDELELVASTSEANRIVEAMQLSAVAGPCIDAYRRSEVVSVPDIAAMPDAYSVFRASALEQGFRSVYAIPLRLRANTIGAVNLLRITTGELNATDRRAAQVLTDVATIGILQERSIRAGEVLQQQLQHALDSRVVIEQAKGVLAHTHHLTMDEAFERLRGFARSERISIATAARGLVDRTRLF
jgi:transcriptional regulator with GAF, ATPase, and Fis domain